MSRWGAVSRPNLTVRSSLMPSLLNLVPVQKTGTDFWCLCYAIWHRCFMFCNQLTYDDGGMNVYPPLATPLTTPSGTSRNFMLYVADMDVTNSTQYQWLQMVCDRFTTAELYTSITRYKLWQASSTAGGVRTPPFPRYPPARRFIFRN